MKYCALRASLRCTAGLRQRGIGSLVLRCVALKGWPLPWNGRHLVGWHASKAEPALPATPCFDRCARRRVWLAEGEGMGTPRFCLTPQRTRRLRKKRWATQLCSEEKKNRKRCATRGSIRL